MSSGRNRCLFCREPMIDGKEENYKRMRKRVKVNDPAAIVQMGAIREEEGDYDKAFEYYTNAVNLGDLEAHYHLGCMYHDGEGVEKDEEKVV